MFKNTLKRLGAIVLALAMAMSVMMVSAFAADAPTGVYESPASIPIEKIVDAEDNVLAPNTEFTFTVSPVASDTTKTNGNDTVVVYKGVEGGATFAENAATITFAPGDALSKESAITLNAGVFTKPGVYRYEVAETTPADTDKYDGIGYSTEKYWLDLYVEARTNSNEETYYVITYVEVIKQGQTEAKSKVQFTNTYATNNLAVTKKIAGNQGDKTEKWDFTIIINGETGEKYATDYEISATDDEDTNSPLIMESGKTYTVSLGDNQTINIYGLSAGDTYTVTETAANTDGYTTTVTDANGDTVNWDVKEDPNAEEPEVLVGTVSGTTKNGDVAITYTNDKSVSTPTGVIMNIAPYVLMVALAGGIAFFFLRRRNAE